MPTLRQGSSGPDVTNLQQKLKDLGFDPNGVDGNFGPGTRDSFFKAFQRSKDLRLMAWRAADESSGTLGNHSTG